MAQAVNPLADDGSKPKAGESQMPCITLSPSRAWDNFQGERDGDRGREAVKATVEPSAKLNGTASVPVLFHAAVAFLALISVTCCLTPWLIQTGNQIEVSARIVVKAEGRWLGNMAQAVNPLADDGSYVPPARVT